jgi:hypothetical protein
VFLFGNSEGGRFMDERVRSGASDYEDYPNYEWRWWHNLLGLAIVLAIVIVMSW